MLKQAAASMEATLEPFLGGLDAIARLFGMAAIVTAGCAESGDAAEVVGGLHAMIENIAAPWLATAKSLREIAEKIESAEISLQRGSR